MFTGSSGLRTASESALRKVARIRCLVERLITRWLRTEAHTLGSAESRHSRMWTLLPLTGAMRTVGRPRVGHQITGCYPSQGR